MKIIMQFSFLLSFFASSAILKADDSINADRPGLADGSAVIGSCRFQIETGLQGSYQHHLHSNESDYAVPTLFRLGLSDDWELRVEGNTLSYNREYQSGVSESHSGIAPTSFGFKYEFQNSEKQGDPSAAVIFRLSPPGGTATLKTKHVNADVRLATDIDFDSFSLEGNLGFAIYEDDHSRVFPAGLAALTLTKNITQESAVFVDAGFQEPEARHSASSLIFDTGFTYLLSQDTQLDISTGTGVAGRTSPDIFWGAGFATRFSL